MSSQVLSPHEGLELAPIRPLAEEGVSIETDVYKRAALIAGAVVPYALEVPCEVDDPHAVVIGNGYMGKQFGYGDFGAKIAQLRRPSITINPPRTQGRGTYDPRNLFWPMRLHSQAMWGVIRDVRQNFDGIIDTSQFDIAAHSMGTPVSVSLASEKPEAIRTLVLVEGAGLEDHHDTIDFVPRVTAFIKDELIPYVVSEDTKPGKGKAHALRSEVHYALAHPLRTAAEGLAVSNCYIPHEVLRRLKEKNGIGIVALLGAQDRLLPAERTIAHSWHMFDAATVLNSGHLLPISQPAEAAEAVVDLIMQVQ